MKNKYIYNINNKTSSHEFSLFGLNNGKIHFHKKYFRFLGFVLPLKISVIKTAEITKGSNTFPTVVWVLVSNLEKYVRSLYICRKSYDRAERKMASRIIQHHWVWQESWTAVSLRLVLTPRPSSLAEDFLREHFLIFFVKQNLTSQHFFLWTNKIWGITVYFVDVVGQGVSNLYSFTQRARTPVSPAEGSHRVRLERLLKLFHYIAH